MWHLWHELWYYVILFHRYLFEKHCKNVQPIYCNAVHHSTLCWFYSTYCIFYIGAVSVCLEGGLGWSNIDSANSWGINIPNLYADTSQNNLYNYSPPSPSLSTQTTVYIPPTPFFNSLPYVFLSSTFYSSYSLIFTLISNLTTVSIFVVNFHFDFLFLTYTLT